MSVPLLTTSQTKSIVYFKEIPYLHAIILLYYIRFFVQVATRIVLDCGLGIVT